MDIRLRDKVDTQHMVTVLWGGMSGHSTVSVIQSWMYGWIQEETVNTRCILTVL